MVRPASSPLFKAVWSLGMLPTAVKAAIGAMPVLDTGRAPHHVAGADLLDRLAPFLGQAYARRHHKELPLGVGVPGRARARLKGHQAARGTDVAIGRPNRIDPHPAGKEDRGTDSRRLSTRSCDLLGGCECRSTPLLLGCACRGG